MAEFYFKHPTTIVLAGPTQCGKTQFLIKAIRTGRFSPEPQRIVWVYGEMQVAYEELAQYIGIEYQVLSS